MPPPGSPSNTTFPATVANRFGVKIDGIETFFQELQGIWSEVESVDFYYTTSDGKNHLSKLPGKYKSPSISLKRGSDSNLKLWGWHQLLRDGNLAAAQKTGTLYIYSPDPNAKPVAVFNFEGAWCSKLSVNAVKAGGGEVLIEDCTITCESLERIS